MYACNNSKPYGLEEPLSCSQKPPLSAASQRVRRCRSVRKKSHHDEPQNLHVGLYIIIIIIIFVISCTVFIIVIMIIIT